MTRWEYHQDFLPEVWKDYSQEEYAKNRAIRLAHMNALGDLGWELIELKFGDTGIVSFWKRPSG